MDNLGQGLFVRKWLVMGVIVAAPADLAGDGLQARGGGCVSIAHRASVEYPLPAPWQASHPTPSSIA